MGDRTWVKISYHIADMDRVRAITNDAKTHEVEGNIATDEHFEVNYGGSSWIDAMVEQNIPFLLKYGASGNYDPGLVAFDGIVEIETCTTDGHYPSVNVLPSGKIKRCQMSDAKQYWAVQSRVMQIFQQSECEYRGKLDHRIRAQQNALSRRKTKTVRARGVLSSLEGKDESD